MHSIGECTIPCIPICSCIHATPVTASRSSHSIDGCMLIHSHPCIRVYMIQPNCCPRACTCRCSGDFTQAKQTKYAQALPGLSSRAISEHLPADLTEAEQAVAEQPGMYGRIWYGQGLCFDEAYQILQDRGVYTHTHTSTGPSHTASACIAFAPHQVHIHPVLLIIAITLSPRASHLHPSACAHASVDGYNTTGTVRAQRPAGEEDWAEHIRPEPERRLVQQVCPNWQI